MTFVPRWMRIVFVANLVAQTAIVVTGAMVRLTGSGLGCPTWPECVEGSYVPVARQEEAWHKYVEFGNRLLTFAVGVIAILAVVAAIMYTVRRARAGKPMRPSWCPLRSSPLPLLWWFVHAMPVTPRSCFMLVRQSGPTPGHSLP